MHTTFSFPLLVCLIPGVVAAIPMIIGLFLLRRIRVVAFVLFAVSLGIAVLFGPMLFCDRVTVTQAGLTQTTGFWFVPSVKGFQFSETKSITITTEITRNGLRNEIWHIHKADGTTERIDPGDLWEMNSDEIIPILNEHDIAVTKASN